MDVSLFLKIKSVISVFFGVLLALLPAYLMPIYGISLSMPGNVIAQWSGALLIGVGIICWYASAAEKSDLRGGVLLALFVCDTIGFVVTLVGQLSGMANSLGWSTVGLWLVLALGLGYFRFVRRDA